jgi:hypothetical protein
LTADKFEHGFESENIMEIEQFMLEKTTTLQTSLFDITPARILSKKEREKIEADRRLSIAQDAFEFQDERFKDAFKDYFEAFLRAHKGERFVFPDVTLPYSRRRDLIQPKKDFRAVGAVAIKYQKLGRIKQVATTKDAKSKRIIPIYEVL